MNFFILGSTGLHAIDYLIVAVYMLAMLGIGWHLSRRQETTEDFFVAGRNMPWLFTGLSMIATLMSTLTYLGTPGEMIQHGIAQGISLCSLPFAYLVVGYLWVPFFMRLRLTSAYEYLELRFGTTSRLCGVAIYLYMRFLWMGAIIYTASFAIAQMTEASAPGAIATLTGGLVELNPTSWFFVVLISTGMISTLYTMLGGIRAVIWTDVVQFLVLLIGAVTALIVIAQQTGTGPAAWWRQATTESHELPAFASWDLSLRETVLWSLLAGFFWHVCTHASDQVALQRYFSTRDAVAARRTAAVNYAMDFLMAILLNLVGMALLVFYLQRPDELPAGIVDARAPEFADRIFPHFIVSAMPVGLSGFVVAAVFAVAQSSIDSGINSTATVITVDLVRRFRQQPLSERQELMFAKVLTVFIGLFVTVTGVAIVFLKDRSNILDLQFRSFNCVLGPLGAVFMAGILLRHVGQKAAVISLLFGVASGLLMAHIELLWDVRGPSVFLIIPISWIVTFVPAAVLGAFLAPPREQQITGLTWQSVMRGERRQTEV